MSINVLRCLMNSTSNRVRLWFLWTLANITVSLQNGIILKDSYDGTQYGDDLYSGRLEICHNGEWGTVCDDMFPYYVSNGCQVICNQLGYTKCDNSSGINGELTELFAPGGTGYIWMDNVHCATGTESTIANCSHNGWLTHNCQHWEDSTIQCSGFKGGGRVATWCGPTAEPTLSPSTDPTLEPTFDPTTSIPTASPTKIPTTSSPTIEPTIDPTADPTKEGMPRCIGCISMIFF